MPPKARYTKEMVIDAALKIVKELGFEKLSARNLASCLKCSIKPIFHLFENMDEVIKCVYERSFDIFFKYINDFEHYQLPPYKAMGLNYIRFAKEERNIYKLLFMSSRSDNSKMIPMQDMDFALSVLSKQLNISKEDAYHFHVNMWLYIHGIATMIVTSYMDLNEEEIGKYLTDEYSALLSLYKKG